MKKKLIEVSLPPEKLTNRGTAAGARPPRDLCDFYRARKTIRPLTKGSKGT